MSFSTPVTYLSSNTAGQTFIAGPVQYLHGGSNITVSGSSNSIWIHGAAGGTGGSGGGIAAAAGTQTATSGTVVWSNSNNITFGMSGSTRVTATVNARASNDAVGLNTAQTNVVWTVNSSGISINGSGYAGTNTAGTNVTWTVNSSGISLNASGYGGTATATTGPVSVSHNSGGLSVNVQAAGTATGATGMGLTVNTGGISVSVTAQNTLSRHEPWRIDTASGFSSFQPASTWFAPFILQEPLAFKWVDVGKSFSVAFPAGTSSATTQTFLHGYTHYVSLFKRVDYGANSESLTYMTHGSFVATLSMTHNQTSIGMSQFWNTDTAGGTSSTNSTSNSTNLASYFSGVRHVRIPFPATTLTEGEYWLAQAHTSSRASTAGTATTIWSVSAFDLAVAPSPALGVFGKSTGTTAFVGADYPAFRGNASAITSNANMPASVISVTGGVFWYVNLCNF